MKGQQTVTQPRAKEVDLGDPASKPPYFNGISDKIDIPYDRDFNPTSFTVEMWVQYLGGIGYQAIFTSASGSGSQGRRGYLFCVNLAQKWQLWLGSGQPGVFWTVMTGSKAQKGEWTHLAGSYNAESQTTIFYVNGVPVGQKRGVRFQPSDRNPLHVAAGATEQPGASPCYFHGSITQIRVWNNALSPTKVKAISDEGLPKGGSKGQQSSGEEEETGSSEQKTSSENEGQTKQPSGGQTGTESGGGTDTTGGQTGTESGGGTDTTGGQTGTESGGGTDTTGDRETSPPSEKPQSSSKYTLALNKQKDYVEVPYSAAINPEQFTVFCWAKVEGGKGQWRSAITSRDNAPLRGYMLYAGNNNCWQFWIGDGQKWVRLNASPIKENTWTALTATYDGSRMKFYINGELVGEKASKYVINSQRNLRIGAGLTEGEPSFFFTGNITEARVWNRARTQEEIQQDLHHRLKGDEDGLVYYSALNAGSGNIVEDKTSNGNRGKIYGTVWEESEVPFADEEGDRATETTGGGMDTTGEGTGEQTGGGTGTTGDGTGTQTGGGTDTTGEGTGTQTGGGTDTTGEGTGEQTSGGTDTTGEGSEQPVGGGTDTTGEGTGGGTGSEQPTDGGTDTTGEGTSGEGTGEQIGGGTDTTGEGTSGEGTGEQIGGGTDTTGEGTGGGTGSEQPVGGGTDTTGEGTGGEGTGEQTGSGEGSGEGEETPTQEETYSPQPALMFDGIDDYIATDLDAQPSALPETTWEAWVKPTAKHGYNAILSTDDGGWDRFAMVDDDRLKVSHGTGAWDVEAADLNSWQHIAVVYTSDKKIKFYKNGTEYVYSGTTTGQETTNSLNIGRNPRDGGMEYFQGYMSEVRVWGTARTPEQITENMNRRLVGTEEGLVGYWPLNEGSGDAVEDKTNKEKKPINGATWEESEVPMKLLQSVLTFDGEDDRFELPLKSIPTGNEITVSFWTKGEGAVAKNGTVIAAVNSAGDRLLNIALSPDGSVAGFDCGSNQETKECDRIEKTAAATNRQGKWSHWAFTKDAATGEMKIYLNGELWHSGTDKTLPLGETQTVCLGNNIDNQNQYQGAIIELAIWNKVRSAEEIKAGMKSCLEGSEEGLVGYWSLNEARGIMVYDNTANNNHGAIKGATWREMEVPTVCAVAEASKWQKDESILSARQVLVFDGQDDAIELSKEPFENNTTFTISLWIKPSVLNSGWHGFIGKKWGPAVHKPSLWVAPNNQGLHYASRSSGRDMEYAGRIENFFEAAEQWIHITWVKEKTEYKFYRNGELFAIRNAPEAFSTDETNFFIGRVDNFFVGEMSEVRIWRFPRTLEEIRGDLQRTLAGNEPGLSYYWQLNEGSGETAHDKVAPNDGTIQNGTWQEAELPIPRGEWATTTRQVLSFERAKKTAIEVKSPFKNNTAFSISLWVKASIPEIPVFSGLIGNQNPEAFQPSLIAFASKKFTDYRKLLAKLNTNQASYDEQVNNFFGIEEEWIHLAWVKEGTEQKFYRNGELFLTRSAPENFSIANASYWIGKGNDNSFFDGQMAEISIWSVARSEAEIKEDMHRSLTGDEPGLSYYWPLNEGSGEIAHDMANRPNNGTINGATWKEVEAPIADESDEGEGEKTPTPTTGDGTKEETGTDDGTGAQTTGGEAEETPQEEEIATDGEEDSPTPEPTYPPQPVLSFDGEDDFVNLGKQPKAKIEKELTLEAWVYIEAGQTWPNSGLVSNFDESNSDRSGYGLLMDDNHGIDFILNLSSNNQIRYTYINSGNIEENKWHHVAGTYNGEVMKIYIDGVEKASKAAPSTGINYDRESDLRLGVYEFDDENYYFQGKIAEVRIWNTARSLAELQKDMHRRLVGNEEGLLAYWPLSEGSGNLVNNKASDAESGTIHGATWEEVEVPVTDEKKNNLVNGDAPKADGGGVEETPVLLFDGENDYLSVPDNPNLRVEAYTLEFWLKPDRPQNETAAAIIGKKRNFSIYLNSAGSVSLRFYPSDNWNFRALKTASDAIKWNQWNHLAVTNNRSTAKMYLNGNLAASRETGGYSTPEPAPLYVARDADLSRGNYFQGQLTEVRIWNFARSEEAIKKDMHSSLGGSEAGLVGCWSLQQDSSNLISEESELARRAIVRGATRQESEGPFEETQSLLVLDGEDDYLSVADNPHLRVKTYTAEVWIKPEEAAEPIWKGIIGKCGWSFQMWLTRAGRIRHFFYVEPSESKVIDTPNGSINWNQWNHVAITNDGTAAKTYINGKLIAEVETGGTLCVEGQPLYLGCSFEKRKGNFKGTIAEARLWNCARSQDEIQQNMNCPLQGNESGLVGYWSPREESGKMVPESDEVANYAIFRGASWQESNLPLP